MPVLRADGAVGTIAGCVPVAAARVGAEMRRLLPAPPADPVPDLVELFGNDARPARAGRPWVVANMIASLDGEIAVEGQQVKVDGRLVIAWSDTLRYRMEKYRLSAEET